MIVLDVSLVLMVRALAIFAALVGAPSVVDGWVDDRVGSRLFL